jgi:hypothetical protein
MAADRTALDFSFVSLVLSVNGRVRPDDLQALPAVQRAHLLAAYYSAKSATEPMYFDGDTLVAGVNPNLAAGSESAVPEPMPAAPAPSSPLEAEPFFEPAPTPVSVPGAAAAPTTAAAGAAAGVAVLGAAMAGAPQETPPATDAYAPAYTTEPANAPAPEVPNFFGAPEQPIAEAAPQAIAADAAPLEPVFAPEPQPAPEASDAPDAPDLPAEPASAQEAAPDAVDFFSIPAPDQDSSFFPEDEQSPAGQHGVTFLFWLLPVLLTWVGGLIAFFVLRGKDAKLAKTMLITGIVLTLVYAAVAAAAVFGLGVISTSLPVQKTAVSAATPAGAPPVTTDYPAWKVSGDPGMTSTQELNAKDPNGKLRQDHGYYLQSPDGKVSLLAWYARSAPDAAAIAKKTWSNPDALFKGNVSTDPVGRELVAAMRKDHPKEALLGAYKVGSPKAGTQTYFVGFYLQGTKTAPNSAVRGEHVYTYSAKFGWKQTAADSKSTSAWNSGGAVN